MLRTVFGLAAISLLSVAPAAAQTVSHDPAALRGVPNSRGVNPAPDAGGPYVGAGVNDFYQPMVREKAIRTRIEAAVRSGRLDRRDARLATRDLARVDSEARIQRVRHGGDLRDWDRERLNDMMNHLVTQFPSLHS